MEASSTTSQDQALDEIGIARLLLRKKYISESQLRAALDYQKSLGGKLLDVIIKLDLIRAAQLEAFLDKIARGEDPPECEDGVPSLDPAQVAVSELKLHRRLLDKVPAEFVERYGIVTFFPRPGGDSRKVILGHTGELPRETAERIRSILGVNLVTLALEPGVADQALERAGMRRLDAPRADASHAAKPRAAAAASGEPSEVSFLVNLLVRKGIITPEELEAFAHVRDLARRREP